MHRDNFYSNGILGGTAPCAVGSALAEKLGDTRAIVCLFLGDGALAEGAVHESLNMAALWELPLLVCVEANGYAQSTPTSLEHAGDIGRRAESYGIATSRLPAPTSPPWRRTRPRSRPRARDHATAFPRA